MVAYKQDPGLESLGRELIEKHHPNLKILKICYLFRPEAAMSGDHLIAGMAVRLDDRNWSVHHFDFAIEIAKDVWDDATTEFRTALLDHELCHVAIRFDEEDTPMSDEKTGRWKTYLRKHDVEEFDAILDRYGGYHAELRDFLKRQTEKRLTKEEA